MSNTKFDEFSYENELVRLSDALTDDGTLLDCYDRFSLYCPYCQSVRLKFYSRTSQKNAYLATWPDSKHADYCPASFTPAKKKETVEHYKSLSSEQIQNKLASYMRRFTSKKSANSSMNNANHVGSARITGSLISSKEKYVLPQKSLKTRINQIDDNLRNIPIVFYGKVYVEFELHCGGDANQIILKNEFSKKSFLRMNNGSSKFNIPENFDKDTLYMMVFIGIYGSSGDYPSLIKYGAFSIVPVNQ